MLISKHFHFISHNPLSRFPHGGKALFDAPYHWVKAGKGIQTI